LHRKALFPFIIIIVFIVFLGHKEARAQGGLYNTPAGGMNDNNPFNQNIDSSGVDSMKADWVDEQAKIYYKHLHSEIIHHPDTSISNLHRFRQTQPWWGNNLGNYGSAVRNLFFTPDEAIGPHLGYRIYDLYKIRLDSLRYYNTTRPYSAFSFMLGSKEQQNVEILHTQNITPLWNFAGRLRYYSSPGFYALQKAGNMGASFNTNYASKNQRYNMKAAFVYNKFKQDENGGILSDSFLDLKTYSDRQRIPVNFPAQTSGNTASAVKNMLRTVDFFVENNYSWGKADTVYNKDSTKATYRFTPRFRLQHELRLHGEKHQFEDKYPDSLRYAFMKPVSFQYGDSVFSVQTWFYADNRLSMNGFIGKEEHLAQVQAGLGNRLDQFVESYVLNKDKQSSLSNYLFGELKKEAFNDKQWSYRADAAFYFTGKAAGNFELNAFAEKGFGKIGKVAAGIHQNLSNAPFAFEHFKSNFYERSFDLNKMSVTKIWGSLSIPVINLQVTANNYLITNYIYYNEEMQPDQFSNPFSVTQIAVQKKFSLGVFSLNNEVVWQQVTGNAPLHLPAFMFREQLKVESRLFKNALLVATGIDVRYSTPYFSDAYSPYFNQFYYQEQYKADNLPEVSAFFNFKVRNFRAFVMGGQLQQLVSRSNINAPGYPAQDALFRFGFIWVLIN
jgi:hypothetical protein